MVVKRRKMQKVLSDLGVECNWLSAKAKGWQQNRRKSNTACEPVYEQRAKKCSRVSTSEELPILQPTRDAYSSSSSLC